MIPKTIHYCWFGKKAKPNKVQEYIGTWKKHNPDYTIIEWNEDNFDMNVCDYVKEAYLEKKWAFVSDYVRLYVLYEYGGIYLDTDVEVLGSYTPFLENEAFIGVESQVSMCTATIGAEKESSFIKNILESYDNSHFLIDGKMDIVPNSQRIYNILKNEYGYKFKNDTIQHLSACTIYPQEYFSPINCYTNREMRTNNTVSIHRYAGTWKDSKSKAKDKAMVFVTRIIGESNREKIKKLIKRNI